MNVTSSSLPDRYFQHENFNHSLSSDDIVADVFGPEYHRAARIIIIGIMILLSLVGNSLVCIRLLASRHRRRYSKAQVLFLNLAVSDLLVTLLTMTAQLVWEVMGRLWLAGDVFCRIFKVLQTFGLVASTYMLVVIALDRYYAIVRPLAPCPKPNRLVAGAWIISFIPSLPNLYIFRQVQTEDGHCYCASMFYTGIYASYYRQAYMATVLCAVFVLPFVLLVLLYIRILIEMWKQTSTIMEQQRTFTSFPRAKVKTLKLALVIFTAFTVTNLPYFTQEMVLAFGNPNLLDKNILALFGVISASNSSLNPYIYLTFHAKGNLLAQCRTYVKSLRKSRPWTDRFGCGGASRRYSTSQRQTSLSSSTKMIHFNRVSSRAHWEKLKLMVCPSDATCIPTNGAVT